MNSTQVDPLWSLVNRLGPPTGESAALLSELLLNIPESEIRAMSHSLLRILGYDVDGEHPFAGGVAFTVSADASTYFHDRLRALAVLLLDPRHAEIDVRIFERAREERVALVLSPRREVRVKPPRDNMPNVWQPSSILNFLLAVLHSEFTLTEYTLYPWPLRQRRIRELADSLGMTVEQLISIDRAWRRYLS